MFSKSGSLGEPQAVRPLSISGPAPGTVAQGWASRARTRHGAPPRWFAVPCLVVFLVVIAYPTIQGVRYSFTNWDGIGGGGTYVGLSNYRALFHTPEALGALGHTVLIAGVVTVAQNGVGLLLALALHSKLKSRNLLRTVLFAPAVMSPIVVGYMWAFLYEPDGTLANVVGHVTGSTQGVSFLGNPSLAIWSVMFVVVWQYAGLSMVIFLAGLQGVPQELVEAAATEGAGALGRFWWVRRHFLKTALMVNVTLSLVTSFKIFDQVVALTQGGPGNATETLSTLLYNEVFLFNRYGFGMALAVAVFVLVAVVTFAQLRVMRANVQA